MVDSGPAAQQLATIPNRLTLKKPLQFAPNLRVSLLLPLLDNFPAFPFERRFCSHLDTVPDKRLHRIPDTGMNALEHCPERLFSTAAINELKRIKRKALKHIQEIEREALLAHAVTASQHRTAFTL
ncbi:MAG: hypothetical protein CMQ29_16560 [Gammaproteobacteria bacterium]|nr:hypothetical protein [Gammaproteobacteria bacterium]